MEGIYLKNELYDLINKDMSIFEFIQSGSLDGIWYWDLENLEMEWMSPKFWETLGYDPEEKKHLSSEWQDIIFQEDLKLAIENFEKHCSDPSHPYDQIVRYRHKNNSTVWIRCRGLAIRDHRGRAIRMLGAHTDITDLKETEKEISRLTREYEKVFHGTQDAMFLIKVVGNGAFRYVRNNLAHQNKTGIALEQIRSKTPQELLGAEMGNLVSENYSRCVSEGRSIVYEETLNLPGGKRIWLTTLTPIIEDHCVSHIVGSAMDITERKQLEEELKKQANYDNLTGLPNRKLFFERLETLLAESEEKNTPFALLFLDLDGFKSINDTYGHETGDQVLITAGKRIQRCIGKDDTAARMGGDEYAVLIHSAGDQENVAAVVEKIHHSLKETMFIGSSECRINSSIGVAVYPHDGRHSEALLRYADTVMYQVKRTGKGRFAFQNHPVKRIL